MARSEDGSCSLGFSQFEGEAKTEFPLSVVVAGFFKDDHFIDSLVVSESVEIEFIKNDVYSIGAKPLVDIIDHQRNFTVDVSYFQVEDPFDYESSEDRGSEIVDDILGAEFIE